MFRNAELRTTRGQLRLLAVVYAGAVALALVTVALRSVWFERWARDLAEPVNETVAAEITAIASDTSLTTTQRGERLTELADRVHLERLESKAKSWWLPGAKEAPEKFRQLLKARSGGEMKSSDAEALRRAELEMLYGAYLERPDLDPSATLPRTLHKLDAATTLSLVRRTLAVGTPTQKQRALTLLASADDEYRDEAVSLARYASEQARRRGDGSLAAAADAVKQRLRGDIDREGPPWPTTTRGTR